MRMSSRCVLAGVGRKMWGSNWWSGLGTSTGGPSWIAALGPLGVSVLSVLGALVASPTIANYIRHRKQRADERGRVRRTIQLLKAEFGHISRHNSTNLKRMTEAFQKQV